MSNRLIAPEMQDFGSVDLLADILGDAHRGIVYARRWYPPRWALSIAGLDVCAFYAVTHGELVIRTSNGEPHTLREGDIGLVAGDHVIASDEGTEPRPFSIERVRSLAVPDFEGVLCMLSWAYLVDVQSHPVFSHLPPLLLLRAGERDPSVDALIGLLDREFTRFAPGGRTVTSHLVDAMLVCVLRHWIEADSPTPQTWIHGLRDPILARALALMHTEYARAWTLETLARAAGASRATLARNFSAAVGTTPMHFLTERRLTVAKNLRERTTMTLDEIAGEVGYGSGFSLSKAFKREYGVSPAHIGRSNEH